MLFRSLTAILGGSKVSSKITIIKRLLDRVDNLIIGGGMSFTFIKALGGKIGNSIFEKDYVELAKEILALAKEKNVNIYFPKEVLIADDFSENANTNLCDIYEIPDNWEGVDAAPSSIEEWKKIVMDSKTVLWNGPVGVFEIDKFATGTLSMAKILVEATKNGTYTLIGGGDSVAAINKFGLANDVSYVSTGGGALLEFMEGIELPGVKAIRE